MNTTDQLDQHFRVAAPQKKALKRLGIKTIIDLLYHFPTRYSNITQTKLVRDLEHGQEVTLYGRIYKPKTKKGWKSKRPMGTAELTDMNGDTIKIVWFNQPYMAKMLKEGDAVKLTGTISDGKYGLSLNNPEVEQTPDLPIDAHESLFESNAEQHFGFPVYRETRGLSSKWIYHTVVKILSNGILEQLTDPIPKHLLEKYKLPKLDAALVFIHMPQKQPDADAARKRFAFEEIFLIQLKKQQSRARYEAMYSQSIAIDRIKLEAFISRFPFTLTDAQRSSIESILRDLESPKPMSRLLEGDVGSGKTAIAATITQGGCYE